VGLIAWLSIGTMESFVSLVWRGVASNCIRETTCNDTRQSVYGILIM
jgi:hypothetical protein